MGIIGRSHTRSFVLYVYCTSLYLELVSTAPLVLVRLHERSPDFSFRHFIRFLRYLEILCVVFVWRSPHPVTMSNVLVILSCMCFSHMNQRSTPKDRVDINRTGLFMGLSVYQDSGPDRLLPNGADEVVQRTSMGISHRLPGVGACCYLFLFLCDSITMSSWKIRLHRNVEM